jgi:oxygen-independent coproporphyrinogen-3 oxidase
MCDFRISSAEITARFGISGAELQKMYSAAADAFPDMLQITQDGLFIPEGSRPLTRMIARAFDAYDMSKAGHSAAI